jgi:hypothetical protein
VTAARKPSAASKRHQIKCWPEFFDAIQSGVKPFESRENDRDYEVGDTLVLIEFVPHKECGGTGRIWDNGDRCACHCMLGAHPKGRPTGRMLSRVVTYITDFNQREGVVVMGLAARLAAGSRRGK